MTKFKVYLSPSPHGVNTNKCLKSGCYEDKHTRPIANDLKTELEGTGHFEVKIGSTNSGIWARIKESDAWGADIYIPIHTNASKYPSARYLLLMFYADNSTYRKIFNCVAPYLEEIYPGKKKTQYSVRKDLIEVKYPKAKTLYCELGFHTNQEDVNNFIHKSALIAQQMTKGLCDYFGVAYEKAAPTPSKKKIIEEDGLWGQTTTKYTQKYLGTLADGIVSNQLNSCKKYLPNAHTGSWEFSSIRRGGSAMIKKLQDLINASVDGYFGKKSVIALQEFLYSKGFYAGAIDGIMGEGTVIAWQKFLNSVF